mgnify:CR=1 FL=1
MIISLSLCNEPTEEGDGTRKFQVKLKQEFEGKEEKLFELELNHGDLMTMEGLHQLFYLHSVWPGDSKEYQDHPLTKGERINLTWRTLVKHLDGSKECNGLVCPLNRPLMNENGIPVGAFIVPKGKLIKEV